MNGRGWLVGNHFLPRWFTSGVDGICLEYPLPSPSSRGGPGGVGPAGGSGGSVRGRVPGGGAELAASKRPGGGGGCRGAAADTRGRRGDGVLAPGFHRYHHPCRTHHT